MWSDTFHVIAMKALSVWNRLKFANAFLVITVITAALLLSFIGALIISLFASLPGAIR